MIATSRISKDKGEYRLTNPTVSANRDGIVALVAAMRENYSMNTRRAAPLRITILVGALIALGSIGNAAETASAPADSAPPAAPATAAPTTAASTHHHRHYHYHRHRFHPVHEASELFHHATGTQPVRPKPVVN